MSIQEFENHLRRSGERCPYRNLMTVDYSQMAGGGVDSGDDPQQQQNGWWPWIDNGGGGD